MAKALFEITRRSPRPNYSMLSTPTGADYTRGVAFMESATVLDAAALADGSGPIVGFITRDSTQTGPDLGDAIYPGKIQLPFKSGEEASFEFAEEVEAEGASFVDAGILANTAINTPLTFTAGKFALGATGKICEYILVGLPTPTVNTNVRIKARRLGTWIKP